MTDFTPILAGDEHVAICPTCKQWLWKIGPASGFFGNACIERAGRYLASDGDTIMFRGGAMPEPLTVHTQWDAQLLKGECPHCGEGYWFITAAYPETPVGNAGSSPESFLCDESYIDILDQVDGTLRGDADIAAGWVVLRQNARWQDRHIRIDVHMVGPFSGGDNLIGEHGVAACGCGAANGHDIWDKARDLVRAITPIAFEHIRMPQGPSAAAAKLPTL